MHRKIELIAALLTLLLTTMCTFYDQGEAVVSSNGLSCQNRTDFISFKWQESADCYYQCPDQTVRRPEIPGKFSTSSPLYSASKRDLDSQFCGVAVLPTSTQPSATVSPTVPPTRRPATEPPTAVTASKTAPAGSTATGQLPLLTGEVSMCDLAVRLINFRLAQPVPDLNGKTLAVQIAGRETACAINPVNPSLLTCDIPARVSFPARVLVRLDNAVVNDFTYDGSWCAHIVTPFPTVTP